MRIQKMFFFILLTLLVSCDKKECLDCSEEENKWEVLLETIHSTEHTFCPVNFDTPDSLSFAILPDSDEWNDIDNQIDQFNACCVFDSLIVDEISTDALVKAWLDMPFNTNIIRFGYRIVHLDSLLNIYYPLKVLTSKSDVGCKLAYLLVNNLDKILIDSTFEAKYQTLFILLGQQEILNTLSLDEKKYLIGFINEVYKYDIFYKGWSKENNILAWYMACNILINILDEPFYKDVQKSDALVDFISTANIVHDIHGPVYQIIIKHLDFFQL